MSGPEDARGDAGSGQGGHAGATRQKDLPDVPSEGPPGAQGPNDTRDGRGEDESQGQETRERKQQRSPG